MDKVSVENAKHDLL